MTVLMFRGLKKPVVSTSENNTVKKPNSYYWNIELLWNKYFSSVIVKNKSTWENGFFQTSFDFSPSDDFIFFDEYNNGYKGLKTPSCIWKEKPIFLVDNHNCVLLPFFHAFTQQNFSPLHIVHIDAHRDNAFFPHDVSKFSLNREGVLHLQNHCQVCNYLDAGKKIGLIDTITSITQSSEFESFKTPSSPFILNLDIDIFGPEGDAVPLEQKIQTIALAWGRADMICIATSPGFIDQDQAKRLIQILTE